MSSKHSTTVIEVGANQVKLAEFERQHSGVSLARLHVADLKSFDEAQSEMLADVVEAEGFSRRGVIGCLPRQVVNLRMLDLPSTDPAEIGGMVDLQFGKQVPYSRDEVVADYRVLGSPREGYTRVMLVVVQRGVLRERFSLFEDAGLDVTQIVVSSEAVVDWMQAAGIQQEGAGAVVVLDIDAAGTDVVVVSDGALQFTRGIQIGAEQLAAGSGAGELAGEVSQAIEICRGDLPDLEISRVVLTGAAPADGGLADRLGEQLGVPVERVGAESVLEPGTGGADPSTAAQTVSLTALIGVAAGSRDRGMKLFPDSVCMRRRLIDRARGLTLFGLLVIGLLFVGSLHATLKYSVRKQRLDRLTDQVKHTQPIVQRVLNMQEVMRVVGKRRDARFSALNILGEIRQVQTEDVVLDKVDVDIARGQILVSGAGLSRRDIRTLVNNLEQSPLFVNVKEGGATSREGGQFRFQVAGALERE